MRGREVERERNPRSLKRRGSYDQFIVALSVAMRTIYVTRGESDDVRGGGGVGCGLRDGSQRAISAFSASAGELTAATEEGNSSASHRTSVMKTVGTPPD